MIEFEFWAIEIVPGASVRDRFRIEAETFAEACSIAQYNETVSAIAHEREPVMYNQFKQIIK